LLIHYRGTQNYFLELEIAVVTTEVYKIIFLKLEIAVIKKMNTIKYLSFLETTTYLPSFLNLANIKGLKPCLKTTPIPLPLAAPLRIVRFKVKLIILNSSTYLCRVRIHFSVQILISSWLSSSFFLVVM